MFLKMALEPGDGTRENIGLMYYSQEIEINLAIVTKHPVTIL